MEMFLSGQCGLGYFALTITTYREYLIKFEAWQKRREFERMQTRDVCFYIIAPHRGKNSQIHNPSDLYPVTHEEFKHYHQKHAPAKRTRREIKLQQAFFKQLDAK